MYKQHPDLPPIDINQKIWHYYTLPKFLSLLSSSSLYLCRHDKFDDSFEGAMTKMDKAFFESKASGITERMQGDSLGCTYSNCWTKSDVDEYVLWSSYASLKVHDPRCGNETQRTDAFAACRKREVSIFNGNAYLCSRQARKSDA